MKAEELRIGNWVEWEDGDKDTIEIDAVSACGGVSGMSEKGLYITEIKYINPIPLTEEWLLKFGFEPYKGGYELEKSTFDKTYMLVDVLTDQCVRADISYVHELQNLYYALTGEHLKQLDHE